MPLWNVEFHCHTYHSADSLTTLPELLEACRQKGVDRIVITDHNAIAGGVEGADLDPERVIVGEEIKTTAGELLAAYVRERVPKGLPPEEAIARLREQGAFISVSHPFDAWRGGAWPLDVLTQIAPLVDAIEVFNARCNDERPNRQAQAFAAAHGLPGTAGSDAHTAREIGRAVLRLPAFGDAEELKGAVRQGEVVGRLSSPWVHFWSMYARWKKAAAQQKATKR